jgi:hypothetical protein
MRVEDKEPQRRAQRIKRQWSPHYREQRPNLLEKSIANVPRIPFFEQFFRPAYFIYLLRNGYAVAEGIRRKADVKRWGNPDYQNSYPIEVCAEQWMKTDDLVQKHRSSVDRFLTVQYEDLAEHPIETLQSITNFLDVSPMDASKLKRQWGVHGYNRPIENMNLESIARLSDTDMKRVYEVAGRTLEKYEYGTPDTYGSRSHVTKS